MNIPAELAQAIEKEGDRKNLAYYSKASQKLSESYRKKAEGMHYSHEDLMVYLRVRIPATYASIAEVFRRVPDPYITSFLDIGSGPGTGLWAASTCFLHLESCCALEKNVQFAQIGQRLLENCPNQAVKGGSWIVRDAASIPSFPEMDLILMSYSLGEISSSERLPLIDRLWKSAGKFLVVIEPGTPLGYRNIIEVRSHLIAAGASLIAPCPAEHRCPLQGTQDWCHFGVRLARSSFHRKIKGGQLNYEDEKFSYVIFSKTPFERAQQRIIRRPEIGKGHIHMVLCTPEGIQKEIITKKNKELFQKAKKKRWGDDLTAF